MSNSSTAFEPHGKHLIAGKWVAGDDTFTSDPADGAAHTFSAGNADHVSAACAAAEEAIWQYGYTTGTERAKFLDLIADEIDARADQITAIGTSETGLPAGRLEGERGRTTVQLRLFANHIRSDDYLDHRQDKALPDRSPLPRPSLDLVQRPIGPVAVFGASNFPLAFSTAGGDTAAALAAGCPVVVKGHPAHPGTAEIVAEAIHAAIKTLDIHPGVFSLVHSDSQEAGAALVQHPLIRAVGFTGSLRGGRALYDLCAARPEPIPFFGELGSVNPMFILPAAATARATNIGTGWAGSLTMGAGQFCTNPGIALILNGAEADAFVTAARTGLAATDSQVMLTTGIADAYNKGNALVGGLDGVDAILINDPQDRAAKPALYETTGDTFLNTPHLAEEVFGPLGLAVRVKDMDQMRAIAKSLKGQLTCTVQMDAEDHEHAATMLPILERKAGRVLANGFPTGVEVADAMVHGGPYPASTNFGATSVGTLAIRRFLRPVCYQNIPTDLQPST